MIDQTNIDQLSGNATDLQLEQAAAFNHCELFALNALSVGGAVHHTNGVTFTHGGDVIESMIAFPELAESNAATVLDEIVQYYLSHQPKGVGCWSLEPTQPKDLGVMLLARGFQPGWHPNWMALDLAKLNLDHPIPDGLSIQPDNTAPLEKVKGLPYGGTETTIFSEQKPGKTFLQRFIARLNGKVMAHSSVLLTTGPLGAAGIYHVGVLPGMRQRGIGKAVVGAACKYAKDLGYNYALLNGTGYKMYEQLGFRKLGKGHTWWLVTSKLIDHPPTKNEVQLASALGRGDMDELKRIANDIIDYNLTSTLTNGMTLIQLAVHCQQPAAAEWLISLGLAINVMEAWDLGWRDRAAALLAEHPVEANIQFSDRGITMLHIAVENDDEPLAMLALSANPDTGIRDTLYKSTALEWAGHLQRKKMAELIQGYDGKTV